MALRFLPERMPARSVTPISSRGGEPKKWSALSMERPQLGQPVLSSVSWVSQYGQRMAGEVSSIILCPASKSRADSTSGNFCLFPGLAEVPAADAADALALALTYAQAGPLAELPMPTRRRSSREAMTRLVMERLP